jgi:hypothetical protein
VDVLRDVLGLFAGEQLGAGEQLEDHRGGTEQIAACIERVAARLLGRHVAPLAHHLARTRPTAAVRLRGDGDAEVGDLHLAGARDQDVRGRDVAMDDVVAVREVERADDLDRDVERGGQGHRPALVLELAEHRGEVEAVDVLHGDEQRLADAAEVEDLDDVRVRQPNGHLGLGDEPGGELGITRQLGQDPLDRQGLLEPMRTVGLGQKHLRHAADRDAVEHVIALEGFLDGLFHGRA